MNKKSGQALVSLLVVSTIFVLMVTGFLITSLTSNQIGIWSRENQNLKLTALSALALARESLLRDPNYTGETLTLQGTGSTIGVTGGSSKVIDVKSLSQDQSHLVHLNQNADLQLSGSIVFGKIQTLSN